MVQDGDILQLTCFASTQGDEVLNVFHYEYFSEAVTNPSLQDIATAWGIEFDTKILTILNQNLVYNRVLLENLTDGFEFSDGQFTASGDGVGDMLPVHDTFSVKLLRESKVTRNGRKSFSGVSESNSINGIHTLSSAQINDIETFCGEMLVLPVASIAPDDVLLIPTIVGRTKDAAGVYQLDLTKLNPVQGAILSPNIRTQNSRRRP